MADYQTIRTTAAGARSVEIDEGLRAHMTKVYSTMSVGMLITALVSWAVAGLAVSETPTAYQIGADTYLTSMGAAIYASPLKWLIMFAPLLFVFGFSAGINRMSAATAQTVFYMFAAVMGLSISSIFLVFTGVSIVTTFLVTAIAFASLSLYGYTTKKDLSAMGTFLMMGLVGLIVAMIINIFVASSALQFAISLIGVLIFAGLTAYDTQSIKNEYIQMASSGDQEWLGKSAIMGALRLYLDFINMFMFLLQFLGQRE
jgi:FtsH-binding integral membrane protein